MHIVNDGFKIGAESTNWKLQKILKACFTIFRITPTIRDDYISVTGLTTFHFPFSSVLQGMLFRFHDDICQIHDIV